MADLGMDMLHRALEAFLARDAEAARAITLMTIKLTISIIKFTGSCSNG